MFGMLYLLVLFTKDLTPVVWLLDIQERSSRILEAIIFAISSNFRSMFTTLATARTDGEAKDDDN